MRRRTDHLVESLKRLLKARDLTYSDVAKGLGVSVATVKRCFAEGSFTLTRLDEICEWAGISFLELARVAESEIDKPTRLTLAQERALAADPALLSLFHRLISGVDVAQIIAADKVDETLVVAALLRLDKLRLIHLMPGNRVKLATARTIEWRPNGPVRRWFASVIREAFLTIDAPDDCTHWEFAGGRLSAESRKVIEKRIDGLIRDIRHMILVDGALPADQTQSIGVLLASRPSPYTLTLKRSRPAEASAPLGRLSEAAA